MKKWGKRSIAALVVFLFLLVLTSTFLHIKGTRALERQKARWRKLGGVASLEELEKLRPPDPLPEENAAPYYQNIRDRFATVNEKGWVVWDLPSYEDIKTEQPEEWVDPNQDLLQLLHEATSKPHCKPIWKDNLPIGYSLSGDAENPLQYHLIGMVGLGRLLSIEASLRAQRGDGHGAVDSLTAGLSLARHAGADNHLVAFIIETRIKSQIMDSINLIFNSNDILDDGLLESLEKMDYLERMKISFLHDVQTPLALSASSYFEWSEIFQEDLNLRLETKVISSIFALWYPLDLSEHLANKIQQIRAIKPPIGVPQYEEFLNVPPWADVTYQMIPGAGLSGLYLPLIPIFESTGRAEAKTNMAIVSLRARKEKEQFGIYPERMETPLDSFSGQPLDYHLKGDGFIVRSVGLEYDNSPIEWYWE